MRGQPAVRVRPLLAVDDRNARVARGVLAEVQDDRAIHVAGDRHRSQRVEPDLAVDVLPDRARVGTQQRGQPQDDAVAGHRARDERRIELQLEARPVRHQRVAVDVDDVAARGGDRHLLDLLRRRARPVRVGRQHLQRPQAEDQDGEDEQADGAEHGHAQRQLRRLRTLLAGLRRGRQEHRQTRSRGRARTCGGAGSGPVADRADRGAAGRTAGSRAARRAPRTAGRRA